MTIIIEYQYFANINLYKILYNNTNIIFEQCENFQKSSFRNKMVLAGPNGQQQLSIPILGGRGVKMKMGEVRIDNRENWKTNHIKTINNLYNRSPWYEFYKTEVEDLYKMDMDLLKDWNMECFHWACKKLKINANVAETQNFELNYNEEDYLDLRNNTTKNSNMLTKETVLYNQVFQEKNGFFPNISILDLLFCEGPNAKNLLQNS